jgi:hypothetical protein
VESFSSTHLTVKKEISPDCKASTVQHVSNIIMEKRRITIDEMQLATSLCHATIYTIIHEDLKMKKVCAH